MNVTTEMKNGKIPFKFSPHFKEKFETSMKVYQMALDKLNDAVNTSSDCDYGYCSNKYSVRLITPNDISTFTSNLIKAFRIGMLQYNIDDIQKFSVQSAYRFIADHEDTPFDDTNVLGAFSGTYINPRDFTLTDLLTIAHNEVFPTSLKSNYEIGVQKMNIKEDLRKVNDLHFSGVMKNIVNALPGLIDRSDSIWQVYRPLLSETFVNAIEGFIMFAILLNTCTIVGMTNYVDPTVNYKTKELGNGDNEVHQESVNTTKNKPVFIVLSEGKTPLLSEAIRIKTKSNFSHASISFDPSLKKMWSYGRPSLNPDGTMNNVKFGFKNEDIDDRLFRGKHINIGVYAIYLPSKAVTEMEKYIEGYLGMKTKFDWGAMLSQLFSKDKEPNEDKYRRICSTFVDTVLKQVGVNLTGKNSPNPGDFQAVLDSSDTKKVVNVFYGDSNNYSPSVAKKKLKAFTSDKASVTYESFVTECCLLKTDDTVFRSKIPFGINFRELVLGDMTPKFTDVKASLYYIIKNPNSPIAQLLTKYVTLNNVCLPDATAVTNMIFKYNETNHDTVDSWYNQRTGNRVFEDMYDLYDFHTDVDWLDKIVYGDINYDGNYRRDNPGNQNVHPILNTLDTIYHIYGDKHLVTNEEVANHIIGVGNVMLGIINSYCHNEVNNYQIVKDVLAVLGDIITRCILKLYHNNTIVIDNSDSMNDTMAPGYLYVESFVMEADDNNTQVNTNNSANAKPTVNVTRNANNSNATNKFRNIKMALGNLISKFVRWIHDSLQKVFTKFSERHRLEYTWVKNNQQLNSEIASALDSQNLNVTVNNFPDYKVNMQALTNVQNYGDKIKNALETSDFKADKLFEELLPSGLTMKYNEEAKGTNDLKLQNFVLYGDENYQPKQEATKVTGPMFKSICDNILNTEQALKFFGKVAKELDAASNALKKKCDELEAASKNNTNNGNVTSESYSATSTDEIFVEGDNDTPPQINEGKKGPVYDAQQKTTTSDAINKQTDFNRVKQVYDVVNKVSQLYAVNTTNTLINKFYKNSYNVYRDIVQAYKQEGSNNNNQNTPATAEAQPNTNNQEVNNNG